MASGSHRHTLPDLTAYVTIAMIAVTILTVADPLDVPGILTGPTR